MPQSPPTAPGRTHNTSHREFAPVRTCRPQDCNGRNESTADSPQHAHLRRSCLSGRGRVWCFAIAGVAKKQLATRTSGSPSPDEGSHSWARPQVEASHNGEAPQAASLLQYRRSLYDTCAQVRRLPVDSCRAGPLCRYRLEEEQPGRLSTRRPPLRLHADDGRDRIRSPDAHWRRHQPPRELPQPAARDARTTAQAKRHRDTLER